MSCQNQLDAIFLVTVLAVFAALVIVMWGVSMTEGDDGNK